MVEIVETYHRFVLGKHTEFQKIPNTDFMNTVDMSREEALALFEELKQPLSQLVKEDHADEWDKSMHIGWSNDPKARILELYGREGLIASYYIRVERPWGYWEFDLPQERRHIWKGEEEV